MQRELVAAKKEANQAEVDGDELEDMLSKFEPGFSETISARIRELNAEVTETQDHLVQVC
jgi:hypothetical protein